MLGAAALYSAFTEPLSEEEQRQLASAKKGKGPVSINNVIIARHELKALLSKSGEASDRVSLGRSTMPIAGLVACSSDSHGVQMVEALLKALPYPGVVASNHPFFGESYLCCMAGPKGCTVSEGDRQCVTPTAQPASCRAVVCLQHQQLVQLKHQQLAKKDEIKIALPEHEGSIFNSSAPWVRMGHHQSPSGLTAWLDLPCWLSCHVAPLDS